MRSLPTIDNMSDSDEVTSPVQDGQGKNNLGTEADATLDNNSAHSADGATPVDHNETNDSATSFSSAQGEQNTDHSRSDLDARFDRVLTNFRKIATSADKNETSKSVTSPTQRGQNTDQGIVQAEAALNNARAHSEKSATPAHYDDISDSAASPPRTDLDGDLASAHEVNAKLERVLAHVLSGATPARAPPPASMAYTREEVLKKDQSTCPLFRLPPELRNTIYTYAFRSKYGMSPFQWDEKHDCPKITLKRAQSHAPPNELLRTCRSIYAEGKGIFVDAKTQYWSNTTFTLTLGARPPASSFGYLECLLDEQVSRMTRVNITVHGSPPFAVQLHSGPKADDSVTYSATTAGCSHRHCILPAPLRFVERVAGRDQARGPLNYSLVVDMLSHGSRGLGGPWMILCLECRTQPVVLSVQDLSRAGLMAVVAWTCHGAK